MKIAVDVMGSDLGPAEIVAGAMRWSLENRQSLALVGAKTFLDPELKKYDYPEELIEVIPAEEIITMEESPAAAVRNKPDASVIVATKLVREKQADAIVSCGNTGAQMAAALLILGRIAGVERPPIAIPLPNLRQRTTLLVDGGANVDCSPKQLLQFGLMGSVYSAEVLKTAQPRVALLNNGSEAQKGSGATIEAHQLLAQAKVNFIGNIEGREILSGNCDVVVCDGFIGNIVLKTIEGIASAIAGLLITQGNPVPDVFSGLDYRRIGGAVLLGVKGISIVCHGSSDQEAVYSAIQAARFCLENQVVDKQTRTLKT